MKSRAFGWAAVLALLVGCATPEEAARAQESYRLVGVAAPRTPPDGWAEARITAMFDWTGGRIAGRGGCNQYTGKLTEDGQRIRIGPIAATRMACTEPPDVMRREQTFLSMLERAERVEREGTRLILVLPGGRERLVFEAAT